MLCKDYQDQLTCWKYALVLPTWQYGSSFFFFQVLTVRHYWRRRIQRGGGNAAGASCANDVDAIGAIRVKALLEKALAAWASPHTWQRYQIFENIELRAFCLKHSNSQDNRGILPFGDSLAMGNNFLEANGLPVNSEHKLKIGCGKTNENAFASDSLSFAHVLKKLIDHGKVDAMDVAMEIEISPAALTANINGITGDIRADQLDYENPESSNEGSRDATVVVCRIEWDAPAGDELEFELLQNEHKSFLVLGWMEVSNLHKKCGTNGVEDIAYDNYVQL
ncbi:hypothetical protein PIB30_009335 [Stylosanthes scabra]|uniref:Uncharacterized protein n=1 Tax=Stylosanthes scabra TaxID=79078 RepID=A0ABU6U5D9_9FABA|nr:hypothetical protein [Stylosanthes scabra]